MSIVTIKITIITALFAVVAAFIAIAMDTQNAAAQSRYLAPAFNTSIVKHADVDQNERMDIPFGSDDAAYRAASTSSSRSLFSTLLQVVAAVLPGTSAPHGAYTCPLFAHGVQVDTVTSDNPCS